MKKTIQKEDKFKTNPFAKKYKAKLDAKKEVWGIKLDKDIAEFKAKAIKNNNVSLCIVTTKENETGTLIVNHKGNSMVFVAAFLKAMDKTCPEALRMGMLKWMSDK